MSEDIRKDILLESFQVLITDYKKNFREINEIIGKIAAIDISTALDMWEYLMDKNPKLITANSGGFMNDEAYFLTSNIIYILSENIGRSDAANAIISRPNIKNIIFGVSASVDGTQSSIIAEFIKREDLNTANELLQLVFSNKIQHFGSSKTIGGFFQNLIDDLRFDDLRSGISDTSIEFIQHWIQQIKDPQDKAKSNVRLLNLIK